MPKILLVDDEEQFRTWLRIVLERAGYAVVEATDGSSGIALVQRDKVDVVICDIYMPGKEGIETITELHRDYPGLKVIAVSGGTVLSEQYDALKVVSYIGAHKILTKPFSANDILEALAELLSTPQD